MAAILTNTSAMDATIVARTCYLVCHISEVEIRLRWRISRCEGYLEKAKGIFTDSRWGDLAKSVKAAAAQHDDYPKDKMAVLDKILATTIPKRASCYDAAKERSGLNDEQIGAALLRYLTFSELGVLAKEMIGLSPTEFEAITSLNTARNDIAHFRHMSQEHFIKAVKHSIDTIRRICPSNG